MRIDSFKKGVAVFMSFILVFSIFSIYNAEEVSADVPNCCIETQTGSYCIDSETQVDGCIESVMGECSSNDRCDEGTCVPPTGVCLSSYPKEQCEDAGGMWYAASESAVSECQLGCCKDTLVSGVMQKTECPGEFISGLTNYEECYLESRPETLGCCVSGGSCTYQRVDQGCDGTFYDDQYCSQVQFCASRYPTHQYTACGNPNLIPEADKDVYWYDQAGNMEEMVGLDNPLTGHPEFIDWEGDGQQSEGDCLYPDEQCFDPDDKGGRENAYCKSTACVVDCPSCSPSSFKHGETMCLRIFGGQFSNDRRSSYLREHIISCDKGTVVEDRELDRSTEVCIDGSKMFGDVSRMYASSTTNYWEECLGCGGESSGIWDYASYIPFLGGPLVSIGTWCAPTDNALFGTVPLNLGGADQCEDLRVGVTQMCYYDSDYWAPIGSCNPIYPPAIRTEEQCDKCGKGGDGKVNMCTEQECNALGDCHFERTHGLDQYLGTAALALGTAVGIMGLSEGICAAAAAFGGQPAWLGCKSGFLSGIASLYTSLLYWGVFGIVAGTIASESSGYDGLNEYGYSFENDDGTYNMASLVAIARSLEYALDNESQTDLSVDEGDESEEVDYEAGFSEGYWGEGLTGLVNGAAYSLTFLGATETIFTGEIITQLGEHAILHGAMATVATVIGAVVSTYFVTESFSAGDCYPEPAYTDNKHCSQCGGLEGQFFCTKERCDILGGEYDHCHWEAKVPGVNDGLCLPADPTDTTPPSVEYIKSGMYNGSGIYVDEKEVNGHVLDLPEYDWYDASEVRINITTDERSKCRAAFSSNTNFEDMAPSSGGYEFDGRFTTYHHLEFNLTRNVKANEEATLFIKCIDVSGNANPQNDDLNKINYQFTEEPNDVPPEFVEIDPYNSIFLPDGTTELALELTVRDKDGVDGCKYSEENKSNYDEMENDFSLIRRESCPGSALGNDCHVYSANFDLTREGIEIDVTGVGYEENATLFDYIFGCVDEYDNFASINYSLTVYPSFDMNITYPDEGDEVYDSSPQVNISTSVDALCSYKLDDFVNWTNLNDLVSGKEHSYELEEDLEGTVSGRRYNLKVRCRDIAFNYITKEVNFYVMADESPAYPVRIYTTGGFGSGYLHVVLNEMAGCKFSTEDDEFEFNDDEEEDVTFMAPVPPTETVDDRILAEEQTTTWNSDVYHIICRDEWENQGRFTIYP